MPTVFAYRAWERRHGRRQLRGHQKMGGVGCGVVEVPMGQRHDARTAFEDDNLFVRLAPVLNVRDLAAERAFYECLGLRVSYEGNEYPDFIAFAAGDLEFGIQRAAVRNDPPSVLTWQLVVSDVDAVLERCREAGLPHEVEQNDPAPGWSYRRVILETPSGYRLALEGMNEPSGG